MRDGLQPGVLLQVVGAVAAGELHREAAQEVGVLEQGVHGVIAGRHRGDNNTARRRRVGPDPT
jgi:hypothetical protein